MIPAIMADVEEVKVVVAHDEPVTLRVGDVFLKIDVDQTLTVVKVEAIAMAPIPTPEVVAVATRACARRPSRTALGRLGGPLTGHLRPGRRRCRRRMLA